MLLAISQSTSSVFRLILIFRTPSVILYTSKINMQGRGNWYTCTIGTISSKLVYSPDLSQAFTELKSTNQYLTSLTLNSKILTAINKQRDLHACRCVTARATFDSNVTPYIPSRTQSMFSMSSVSGLNVVADQCKSKHWIPLDLSKEEQRVWIFVKFIDVPTK